MKDRACLWGVAAAMVALYALVDCGSSGGASSGGDEAGRRGRRRWWRRGAEGGGGGSDGASDGAVSTDGAGTDGRMATDGDAGDSGDARDSGHAADSGDAGNSGDAGDSGNAADSGDAGGPVRCTWPGDGVPTVVSVPTGGVAVQASDGVIARAGNGHVLAVWTEQVGGQTHMFGAEYAGAVWGQPIDLGAGESAPSVAATASAFVVAWSVSGTRFVAKWTGSGLATPTNLGSSFQLGNFFVASDGTRLVAAWAAQSAINTASGIWSSTSTDDGATWGAPVPVETETGYSLMELVGGPAGVAELVLLPAGTLSARVAPAGVWGPAATPSSANQTANGPACEVSVGSSDALFLCVGTTADAQLFDGSAWTDHPPSAPAGSLMSLASDGTDYRFDYVYGPGPLDSTILHAGAWSTPVASPFTPLPVAPKTNYTAGACGTWTVFYSDNSSLTSTLYASQTTGGAAYPKGASLLAGQPIAYGPRIARWPGVVDAVWSGVSSTSQGVQVLYVDLNAK